MMHTTAKAAAHDSLMASVSVYFHQLYNDPDDGFRKYLSSVGNKDAVTGNRMFDRHMAVKQIIAAAEEDLNQKVMDALPGDIYQCVVRLMGALPKEQSNDAHHIAGPNTESRSRED